MEATGTWVILKDPRKTRLEETSLVVLSEATKREIAEEEALKTNQLEILSVGELVKDKKIKVGKLACVDTRVPFLLIPEDPNAVPVVNVIVVQENQIFAVR